MRRSILFAVGALVILPLVGLAYVSARFVEDEQRRVDEALSRLEAAQLQTVVDLVARLVESHRAQTLAELELERTDRDAMNRLADEQRLIRRVFSLDPDGRPFHPRSGEQASEQEQEFWSRTLTQAQAAARGLASQGASGESATAAPGGLHTWYWGDGLHLLVLRRAADGGVIGAELDETALLSDIVAALPSTEPTPAQPPRRVELRDERGRTVYAWGRLSSDKAPTVVGQLPLLPPLGAYELVSLATGQGHPRGHLALVSRAVFAALGLAILGLGLFVWSSVTRQARVARQRLTFVSQVSHELKTPLTSIRLYAELLADELEEDEPQRARARVIVEEAERLSRLIANVLTFGRKQRGQLELRPRVASLPEAVERCAERFRPLLERRGLVLTVACESGPRAVFDPDALEQILANLLGNAEKYAVNGSRVSVEARIEQATAVIVVADDGPGIPRKDRERVFEPFVRLGGALTDGVAGTGIGLSISRDLARLHGGDLRLLESGQGARFEVTVAVSFVEEVET